MRVCLLLIVLLCGCASKKLQSYIDETGRVEFEHRLVGVSAKPSENELDLCVQFQNIKDRQIKAVSLRLGNSARTTEVKDYDILFVREGCGPDYQPLALAGALPQKPEEICQQSRGAFAQSRSGDSLYIHSCVAIADGRWEPRRFEARLSTFDSRVANKQNHLYVLYPFAIVADAATVALAIVVIFPELTGHGGSRGGNPTTRALGREAGRVILQNVTRPRDEASEPERSR